MYESEGVGGRGTCISVGGLWGLYMPQFSGNAGQISALTHCEHIDGVLHALLPQTYAAAKGRSSGLLQDRVHHNH